MGPAVDMTDGVTPETGLAPTVYLSKNGAVQATRNSAVAIAHDRDGHYRVPLNASDTDTLGHLRAQFNDAATHLPVWEECNILSANIWDSKYSTDRIDVNVREVSDSSTAADNLETVYLTINSAARTGVIHAGTAQAVGASTITLAAGLSAVSNNLVGAVVFIESATTGQLQARVISGWNNTTKVADVDPSWTTTPTGTVTYIVFVAAPATTTSPPAVNLTQWSGSTPNALITGRVDASVGTLATAAKAEVNAEVVDALATDTYAEPTGVPAATDDLATKIGFIYEALRNGLTVTSTKMQFMNDSGTPQWEKDLSDDGTTYTESEGNAP
jgi:hypothetical protein